MTITIDGAEACVIQDAIAQLKAKGTPLSAEPTVDGPQAGFDHAHCDFSGLTPVDMALLSAEIRLGISEYEKNDPPMVLASRLLLARIA